MPRTYKKKTKGGDAPPPDAMYDAKLLGDSSSRYVVFKLKQNQAVCADSASLIYMKDGITYGSIKIGKDNESMTSAMLGFFGRKLSGETGFIQQYDGPGTVALGSSLPGDVTMFAVNPGDTYYLSRGAFIACSPNIRVSGGLNLIGILGIGQEEGFVLPTVTTDNSIGYIWIGAYGTFERHEIPQGQSMLINNGQFLAANKKYDGLKTLGKSAISSMFGEGMGMEFKGPCIVYTQSKNMNELVTYITERMPPKSGGAITFQSSSSEGFVADTPSEGGKAKRNKVRAKNEVSGKSKVNGMFTHGQRQ